MKIIQQARDFVKGLLDAQDPRCCPHCHKRMTKKNGTRPVTVRDLDGVRTERVQRWWCHLCQKSYFVEDPRRAKGARYTRRVKRKGLDLYMHLGGSLRGVAECLRSEINPGTERSVIWDPQVRAKGEPGQRARLSHTSLWRWLQAAGEKARRKEREGRWQGVLRFSGALVADGTGVVVKGVRVPLHLIGDAVSRVGMRVQRLPQESELAIRGQFRALLAWWGLTVAEVKVLISDGASWYQAALDWVLRKAQQQRSIFHLWRNILPLIRAYGAQVGEEVAKQFIAEVKAVWNAASLAAAQEEWLALQARWGAVSALQGVLTLIEKTLTEAMLHTKGIVKGMGRTSNVAERFFRRYKQRLARMGCFMSPDGCDNFNAAWAVYINMEPYQVRRERKKHYRYPGRCPLEVGGALIQGLTWLDLLEI